MRCICSFGYGVPGMPSSLSCSSLGDRTTQGASPHTITRDAISENDSFQQSRGEAFGRAALSAYIHAGINFSVVRWRDWLEILIPADAKTAVPANSGEWIQQVGRNGLG